MIRKSLFSVIALLATASYANAVGFDGLIYFLDNAPAAVGPAGTNSNLSGPNTWHLWALDNHQTPVAGQASNGIYSYSVTMNIPGLGTAGQGAVIRHRSPNGTFDDDNGDTWTVGYSFLRTAGNNNTSASTAGNPIQGLQAVDETSSKFTFGIGKAASNFVAQQDAQGNNAASASPVNVNATNNTGATSWGVGGPGGASATINGNHWVFLAEGGDSAAATLATITAGALTNGQVFNANGTIRAAEAPCIVNDIDTGNACGTSPPPSTIPVTIANDLTFNNVDTTVTPVVNGVMGTTPANATTPITWTLGSVVFTPSNGATLAAGQAAAASATLTPSGDTRQATFNWGTVGAPLGTYVWSPTADNADPAAADGATITVQITAVPEPATFALVGLALFGLVGRRKE
jgi:hypothetical protein